MINTEIKKKFADSWFSYLQNQICNEFEQAENSFKNSKVKFIRRDWKKANHLRAAELHLF